MTRFTHFFREPLVHFFGLGAGIFLLFALVGESEDPLDEIIVSAGQVDRLVQTWQRTWQRPPTPAELEGLIEDYIREEILYREAMAMGLDRDDTIIRRRLRQKMEFLPQDLIDQAEPTEAELQTYLREHADAFQVELRLTFQQIYLSRERRGANTERDARNLLADLESNDAPVEPLALSDPIPLPHEVESLPESEVARLFGQEFVSGLAHIEPGGWTGPVSSGYGLHLVRIRERSPAQMPELKEVREAVEREWRFMRRQEMDEQFFNSLRARYTIEVELPDWLDPETEVVEMKQE